MEIQSLKLILELTWQVNDKRIHPKNRVQISRRHDPPFRNYSWDMNIRFPCVFWSFQTKQDFKEALHRNNIYSYVWVFFVFCDSDYFKTKCLLRVKVHLNSSARTYFECIIRKRGKYFGFFSPLSLNNQVIYRANL